ncbi:cbb3-type cytochrome oxidase subunit 3 [Muricoccus radiodurans]|uniref:cbb3-type cytochrome oxidase subunit 3 n=1 Tax=Muricoccus radiodurans TaxID=2231721 RepID=UPI003CF93792
MPEWMTLLRSAVLVLIVMGSVAAALWLLRPSARRAYDEAALIPLRDEDPPMKESDR